MLLTNAFLPAAGDSNQFAVCGNFKASDLRQLLRADRNGIRQAMTDFVPHHILQLFGLFLIGQIGALCHKRLHKAIIDGLMNQQVAVAGAAGAKVGRFGDSGVHRGFSLPLRRIGGIIDNNGGVAGSGTKRGNTGGICGFHHEPAAGGDNKVAALHQLLSQRDTGLLNALNNICGSTLTNQSFPDDIDAFIGNIFRAGMRGADQYVSGLDCINNLTGRSQTRIGGRHQSGDDAHWFGILDQSLFGNFFNDADTFIAQTITKNQLDFVALIALGYFVAKAGFIYCFIADGGPNLHIAHSGGHSLT